MFYTVNIKISSSEFYDFFMQMPKTVVGIPFIIPNTMENRSSILLMLSPKIYGFNQFGKYYYFDVKFYLEIHIINWKNI